MFSCTVFQTEVTILFHDHVSSGHHSGEPSKGPCWHVEIKVPPWKRSCHDEECDGHGVVLEPQSQTKKLLKIKYFPKFCVRRKNALRELYAKLGLSIFKINCRIFLWGLVQTITSLFLQKYHIFVQYWKTSRKWRKFCICLMVVFWWFPKYISCRKSNQKMDFMTSNFNGGCSWIFSLWIWFQKLNISTFEELVVIGVDRWNFCRNHFCFKFWTCKNKEMLTIQLH